MLPQVLVPRQARRVSVHRGAGDWHSASPRTGPDDAMVGQASLLSRSVAFAFNGHNGTTRGRCAPSVGSGPRQKSAAMTSFGEKKTPLNERGGQLNEVCTREWASLAHVIGQFFSTHRGLPKMLLRRWPRLLWWECRSDSSRWNPESPQFRLRSLLHDTSGRSRTGPIRFQRQAWGARPEACLRS